MFQDTSYTSPEWLLAVYIPPISVARLPFLHVLSCISGFDTFFSMALLTDGKRDFFVALICLSRLLGWPKRASLSRFCRFSCALKAIRIYLLNTVSCISVLLSNPLRCLPSIYLWTRVIIYNSAGLWIAVPLSSIFQLAYWKLAAKAQDCFRPYSGSGRQAEPVLNSSSWWENRVTCACPNT